MIGERKTKDAKEFRPLILMDTGIYQISIHMDFTEAPILVTGSMYSRVP